MHVAIIACTCCVSPKQWARARIGVASVRWLTIRSGGMRRMQIFVRRSNATPACRNFNSTMATSSTMGDCPYRQFLCRQ